HWRGRVMSVSDEPVSGLEIFEIGEAAPLFPKPVGKHGPVGNQNLLPLKADLLQIALELGGRAPLLLALDLLAERVELRFGSRIALIELFLKPLRDLRKLERRLEACGWRGSCAIALHGVLG